MDSATTNTQSRESSTAFESPTYEISYGADHTLQWNPPQGSKELAIALSYHYPLERDLESKMRAATKKFLKAEAKKRKSPGWNAVVQKVKTVLTGARGAGRHERENGPALVSASDSRAKSLTVGKEDDRDIGNVQQLEGPTSRQELAKVKLSGGKNQALLPQHANETGQNVDYDHVSPPQQSSPRALQILKWDPSANRFAKRKKRRYGKEEGSKVAANRGNACADHQRKKMKCDPEICPQNKQNLRFDWLTDGDDIFQESMRDPPGDLNQATADGMIPPSDFSVILKDNTAKLPGNAYSINTQPDLGTFTTHESTNNQVVDTRSADLITSVQAAAVQDDPSLSGLGSGSLEDWAWDPHFFQPEVNDHAQTRPESASYSHTPNFRHSSTEDAFLTDPPYINYADKPHLGPDRVVSQDQVDQQYNTQPLESPQPVISLDEYGAELHLDHGGFISPLLLRQGSTQNNWKGPDRIFSSQRMGDLGNPPPPLGAPDFSNHSKVSELFAPTWGGRARVSRARTRTTEIYPPTTTPIRTWSHTHKIEPTMQDLDGSRIRKTLQKTRNRFSVIVHSGDLQNEDPDIASLTNDLSGVSLNR